MDDRLPTVSEKKWLAFQDDIVLFVQPSLPTQAQCDPWAGKKAIWVESDVITDLT